ncbi:hypothetical protein [Paenibacillus odorifer]|uniref:hypothetical protein n=1 Tax=Paenibacillus odorifer TaxID=189426 RepID=UPI00111562A6|nr:hypothetical protein [Paenibacillus odorifer]
MPKTDLEVRFWQTSDHSHPYSAGLASTLPTGFGVAHLRLDLACTLPIGLGVHASDWTWRARFRLDLANTLPIGRPF